MPVPVSSQSGEVIVTGTLAGKPVRYSRTVSLADAEQGNSFIPRLWARMYLDELLQQGTSQAVIDDVIALSEEYNIITPYTSMLVLESDADRERFAVKSRFRMRDGEKFFAEGRSNANFDLVQQQMRRAGSWRIGMRNSVLQQLVNLGRDAGIFQPAQQYGVNVWSRSIMGVHAAMPMSSTSPVEGPWSGAIGGRSAGEWSFDAGDNFEAESLGRLGDRIAGPSVRENASEYFAWDEAAKAEEQGQQKLRMTLEEDTVLVRR